MTMADAGGLLQQARPAGPATGGRKSRSGLVYQFRKPLVAMCLICGDLVAAVAAITSSDLFIKLIGLHTPLFSRVGAPFLILALFVVGLYSGSGPSPYERVRQRTMAIVCFIAIDSFRALQIENLGAFIVARSSEATLLLLFGHYIESVTRSLLIHFDLWGESTVLVGRGDDSRKVAHLLIRRPELGLTPIGFIKTVGDRPQQMPLPLPVIGTSEDLGAIRPHFEVAIFTTADDLAAVTSQCPTCVPSCQFVLIKDIDNIQSLWLHTRTLDAVIGIEIRRDLCLWHNRLLKRMFDLAVAIPVILVVSPVVAVLALAIKLVDPGRAFYVQDRLGRNGTKVRTFKLRTMYADAEQRLEAHLSRDPQARAEWQRFFKLSQDPRVLPLIGNFMRRFSLDELPQLWNVILGNMSLVGPRPLPSYHANHFDAQFQGVRLNVPPGLTGLWQVSSRSDGDLQVLKEQDLFYIRNWSLWLDLYVLLETLPAVLSARGAR